MGDANAQRAPHTYEGVVKQLRWTGESKSASIRIRTKYNCSPFGKSCALLSGMIVV
jgi:hypothetical protein